MVCGITHKGEDKNQHAVGVEGGGAARTCYPFDGAVSRRGRVDPSRFHVQRSHGCAGLEVDDGRVEGDAALVFGGRWVVRRVGILLLLLLPLLGPGASVF
jgi:hypothetical protein